jgi:AraC family transcriptional activator of mtrCDE
VLRELRLLAAADRLLRSRASVEQVARGVGYASPSSFSRAFTTRFGVNPAAYQASAEE